MRALSLAIFSICQHVQADDDVARCPGSYAGLEVIASVGRAKFSPNDPIPLAITVQNGSSEKIYLRPFMVPIYHWLKFKVVGPSGQLLQYTGTVVKLIDDGKDFVTLHPGYFFGRRIEDLRGWYDLTKPGRYVLRAIYGVAPMGECGDASVLSPSISFEVS